MHTGQRVVLREEGSVLPGGRFMGTAAAPVPIIPLDAVRPSTELPLMLLAPNL